MRRPALSALAIAGLAAACARVERPVPSPALRLAVSEAWNGGSRLVLVDERGDRWAVLSAGRAAAPSRDEQAVFSPDGRWVAFVSSRGRDLARTSLWVMPAAVGATAVRVTDGTGDDVDPVWTPAGDAVVFARRGDATFALARVTIAARGDGVAIGPVERLTTGVGHHVAPSVGPDGDIAYQEIDRDGGRSRIALRAADGSVTFLTDGPRDATPAWRPGGTELAFARAVERPAGGQMHDVRQRVLGVDVAVAHETAQLVRVACAFAREEAALAPDLETAAVVMAVLDVTGRAQLQVDLHRVGIVAGACIQHASTGCVVVQRQLAEIGAATTVTVAVAVAQLVGLRISQIV